MKKHILKPMTEFVLERKEYWRDKCMHENSSEVYCRAKHSMDCENYANFLKRKLTLSMFRLCDEDGQLLPYTIGEKGTLFYAVGSNHIEKARQKVLFKVERDGNDFYLAGHNLISILELYKYVEDLVFFSPFLSDVAVKELGL